MWHFRRHKRLEGSLISGRLWRRKCHIHSQSDSNNDGSSTWFGWVLLLKFLTKCKSGFPKISAMSFSDLKIKEFSKNLLKFSRPRTNLNLSMQRFSSQNGRSWSDYIDDLFDSDFDVP